jgi:hypothetical protein
MFVDDDEDEIEEVVHEEGSAGEFNSPALSSS